MFVHSGGGLEWTCVFPHMPNQILWHCQESQGDEILACPLSCHHASLMVPKPQGEVDRAPVCSSGRDSGSPAPLLTVIESKGCPPFGCDFGWLSGLSCLLWIPQSVPKTDG